MNYAISMVCGALMALVVSCFCSHSRVLSRTSDVLEPPPPCPPIIWKDFLALLGGALGAFLYILLMKVNPTFNSMDFVAANIAAVALGCFIRRLFCPIK